MATSQSQQSKLSWRVSVLTPEREKLLKSIEAEWNTVPVMTAGALYEVDHKIKRDAPYDLLLTNTSDPNFLWKDTTTYRELLKDNPKTYKTFMFLKPEFHFRVGAPVRAYSSSPLASCTPMVCLSFLFNDEKIRWTHFPYPAARKIGLYFTRVF